MIHYKHVCYNPAKLLCIDFVDTISQIKMIPQQTNKASLLILENKEWQYVENNRQSLLAGTCIMQRVSDR